MRICAPVFKNKHRTDCHVWRRKRGAGPARGRHQTQHPVRLERARHRRQTQIPDLLDHDQSERCEDAVSLFTVSECWCVCMGGCVCGCVCVQCVIDPATQTPTDELDAQVIAWCRQVGMQPGCTSVREFYALRDSEPIIRNTIDRAISSANTHVAASRAACVQKWRLVQHEFTLGGSAASGGSAPSGGGGEVGELGPTLKVKRHVVMQKYAELIEEMYSSIA